MAKKVKPLDLIAFIGLILGALILALELIFADKVGAALRPFLYACLFIVTGIKAYDFTVGRPQGVKVTYWVSIILVACLIILPPVLRLF